MQNLVVAFNRLLHRPYLDHSKLSYCRTYDLQRSTPFSGLINNESSTEYQAQPISEDQWKIVGINKLKNRVSGNMSTNGGQTLHGVYRTSEALDILARLQENGVKTHMTETQLFTIRHFSHMRRLLGNDYSETPYRRMDYRQLIGILDPAKRFIEPHYGFNG